jgi:hypothetical protein
MIPYAFAPNPKFAMPPARQQQRAKSRALRVERAQRREDMLEDVISGVERGVIAAKYKVSLKTVYREIDRVLDQRRLDAPDRYVRLQVERLTRALQTIDRAIDDGDFEAIAYLIKLTDKLDRYHGFGFAPVHVEPPTRLASRPAPPALTRERTENGA